MDADENALIDEAAVLLEALLSNSLDLIYFKDRESRFIRCSRSMLAHVGVGDSEALRGKTDFDCYAEEHARPAYEDEQEIIRTGNPIIGKLEKETHPNGHITWALTTKMPWRDAQGETIGTYGISKDVTSLKKVESDLAETSSLLETLLENSPDYIYFKDRQSHFVRYSKSLARAFKADSDQLKGKSDFDLFTKEHAQPAFNDEQEVIRTGQPMIGKPEKETYPDGRVAWALTTKMPWRDVDGNIIGTFGISKDITAIKEAEVKVEQLHKQLLTTSRQAGMAEVATSVLHNVGNTLNSINVSAELLRETFSKSGMVKIPKVLALLLEHQNDMASFLTNDERGKQLLPYLNSLFNHLVSEREQVVIELGSLSKNIDHIKEIVSMQQAYARNSGVLEMLHSSELIEEALQIHAASFQRHTVAVVREFEEAAPIRADRHKVLQILSALLENADHACAEKGGAPSQITVRLGMLGTDRNKIEVVDNGVGIPPENLTRIFSSGFTTRKDGRGFGLHTAALAAQEMGGSLTAQSAGVGEGAAFTLELPVARQPQSKEKS
jgi:PAS domain S-box-containing protein